MFCSKCGKQIEDNIKFCPYCGGKVISSNANNIADTVKKATDTAVNMAQSAKSIANEATNGQAEKYMEKAKETAKNFVEDARQVAKDKDTSNFLTKNKYRNLKIIAVLLVAIFLIGALFTGNDSNEQIAIAAVEKRILEAYPSAEFSDADVIEKDGRGRYLVSLNMDVYNIRRYAIGVVVITSDDIFTSVYPYDDKSEKKAVISEQKSISNWGE